MSAWIYIGPDIPPLGLKRTTLYRDEPQPPYGMREYVAVNPVLGALYVRTDGLAQAKLNLKNHNSVEYLAFEMMKEIGKKIPR